MCRHAYTHTHMRRHAYTNTHKHTHACAHTHILTHTYTHTTGIHIAFERWMKPFNPILGETWQARMEDGTSMCMEQISHHPPISAFIMETTGACAKKPSSWRPQVRVPKNVHTRSLPKSTCGQMCGSTWYACTYVIVVHVLIYRIGQKHIYVYTCIRCVQPFIW